MARIVRKTYQATQAMQLDTYCLVDGQKVAIEFRGGTIQPRINGKYITTDPKVIAQMDADIQRVGANVASYKCIHEEVIDEGWEEPQTGNPSNLLAVPNIQTVTAAREWLINASETGVIKKGITPSMIKNRQDVLKFATDNNVNFLDLPKS